MSFLFYPWLKVTRCIYVFMVSLLKLRPFVMGISHSDFLSLTVSQLLLIRPRGVGSGCVWGVVWGRPAQGSRGPRTRCRALTLALVENFDQCFKGMSVFPMPLTENLELVKSSDVEGFWTHMCEDCGSVCRAAPGRAGPAGPCSPSLLLKTWIFNSRWFYSKSPNLWTLSVS